MSDAIRDEDLAIIKVFKILNIAITTRSNKVKSKEDGLFRESEFTFESISSLESDTIEVESRNKEIMPKLKHRYIALKDFFSKTGKKEKRIDFIDNIFLIT